MFFDSCSENKVFYLNFYPRLLHKAGPYTYYTYQKS